MVVFKDQEQILEAVLTSYEYNYDDKYLIYVYEDVINRLQNGPYRTPTEEGHIINGILTLLYGLIKIKQRLKMILSEYSKSISMSLMIESCGMN